jgi:organic hydroperoxide reductase OsmC/OhrA
MGDGGGVLSRAATVNRSVAAPHVAPVAPGLEEASMTESFRASVRWQRTSPDFTFDTYNRAHELTFGSGTTVQASAAPGYRGEPDRVNPEEQFVSALSSCHMLTFLAVAAKKRLVVESYEDDASGVLAKNADGKLAMTQVVLRPKVEFSGEKVPSPEELAAMHEAAHKGCFIANSVKADVVCEPRH